MNVDENSELRDGDRGFAACYNTDKGNFFNTATFALNYDNPDWTFLGEVKAINKGTAVKSTGKDGWEKTGKYNKNKRTLKDYCDAYGDTGFAAYSDDEVYYIFPYSDAAYSTTKDFIGILSTEGFKNTGLNNGENHLKCWFRGPGKNTNGPAFP